MMSYVVVLTGGACANLYSCFIFIFSIYFSTVISQTYIFSLEVQADV